ITIIHQELNLADNLSVAENIFLWRQPRRGPFGLRDRRLLLELSEKALARVGLRVSPRTILGDLSPGQKQLVEIAKALSRDACLLVFDEPTSSLSTSEAEVLFERIEELKARGIAIVYISHRLGEIARLARRVQVLRDGRPAGFLEGDGITHDAMVRSMVGRDISKFFGHKRNERLEESPVVLSVRGLKVRSSPHRVSFDLHAGEILGMAGLVGAGRTELVRALFGIDPIEEGTVAVHGTPVSVRSPRGAIGAGILLVPEDRKSQGLVLDLPVRENVGLAGLSSYRRWGLLDRSKEREVARGEMERLHIRASSMEVKARNLSGGNQQKVVLGKWLSMGGRVLILDEPTRGVDVGAKQEIYALMSRLASEGLGILMVSSEMEELIAMSDRVLVIHEGRLGGDLAGERITEENVLRLAVGGDAA
ncbi:MAG TPA: sugar ABC transporter ATP-binding protein, partial [Planctomycetota bacterium]|nr:sugar ABC transporter ATP-binding protein [Planctomycetota bacterium]